jgi:hypothetical protein
MRSLTGVGLLVNVVDAFDECDRRKKILEVLAKGQFPDNVRFIITTRAEADIRALLVDKPHVVPLDLNELGASAISGDIKTYAHCHLDRCMFRDVEIDELVSKADGLFQWAATACNYICNDDGKAGVDPRERFSLILSKGSDLDALYRTILEGVFPLEDSAIQSVKLVLAKVLAAAEPLSTSVLKSLSISEAEARAVDRVIPYLGSVLTVSTQSIRPIHTSFRDFLTNPERSDKFWVDIKHGHQSLARASFYIMEKELCFNKCNIKSSYQLNSEITQKQVDCISPALFYSCQFWAGHLKEIKVDDDMQTAVPYFMRKQLLFWLEILSIKQSIKLAIPSLDDLMQWKVRYGFYTASFFLTQ